MSNGKSMPSSDPTKCLICQKGEPVNEYAGICIACYNDGWRAGQEMVDAIRKDDAFLLDRHGKLHVNPLHEEKS